MRILGQLPSGAALTLATLLHATSALPTSQMLQERAGLGLPTACKKFQTSPTDIRYEISSNWQDLDTAHPGLTSGVTVWRDGNDTPVLARPMLQANLDIVLLSFIVKDGKVEDTAGAQFGNNQDLIDKTGKVPLVGPIKIQIGAPAGSNLTEGSPPNQITIIAQRGADSGTGVIKIADCVPS